MQGLAYPCGLWFQWQFNFQNLFNICLVSLVYLVSWAAPAGFWHCLRCKGISPDKASRCHYVGEWCGGPPPISPPLPRCLWVGEHRLGCVEIERFLSLGCLLWRGPFSSFHLLAIVSVGGRIESQTRDTKMASHLGLFAMFNSLVNPFHLVLSGELLFNLGENEAQLPELQDLARSRIKKHWSRWPCSVGWGKCKMPYYSSHHGDPSQFAFS